MIPRKHAKNLQVMGQDRFDALAWQGLVVVKLMSSQMLAPQFSRYEERESRACKRKPKQHNLDSSMTTLDAQANLIFSLKRVVETDVCLVRD